MPTPSSSPPAPATTATPRRRRPLPSRSATSFSSSPFFPPSPSPFHRFLPSTSVPFSWEHRPGIPKTPARPRSSKAGKPLPLPPSLLRRGGAADASSVVPAEYAGMPAPPNARRVRLGRLRVLRRPVAEWLSVLSLCRSCKRAASCFVASTP